MAHFQSNLTKVYNSKNENRELEPNLVFHDSLNEYVLFKEQNPPPYNNDFNNKL